MSNTLIKAQKKLRQGKLDDANKLLSRVLKKDPGNPQTLYLLGETLLLQGRLNEALVKLREAVASGQAKPCWYVMCGVALEKKGLLADAEKSYKLAEMSGCTDEQMYILLGSFYTNSYQNYQKAEQYYTSLIKMNPNAFLAYVGLSRLYIKQERYEDAIQALDYCLSNEYETADVYINLGHALSHQGRQKDALTCNRKAIEILPTSIIARQNCILQLLYTLDDQSEIYRETIEHASKINDLVEPRFTHTIDCNPDRKLKLGFISADIRKHAISYYFTPIYNLFNKDLFSLHVYYNNILYDDITEKVKKRSDSWCECQLYDDEQLANQIHFDKIDILIDLSNHTSGNRLTTFCKRPAPMQVSWMGAPISTGLECMDFSLKDKSLLEICKFADNATEIILPVEKLTFYDPLVELPPLSEPPCIKNGYITFGSFNGLQKVDQNLIETWAKILHQVPESRIRMVVEDFNNSLMKEYIFDHFIKFDIDKSRIELQPRLSLEGYLESHNKVDIALDPYPFHGETTTYNLLLMGLPLVSRAGKSTVSNISTRILSVLNRQEWVAKDFQEYIEIAITLAMDTDRLVTIRQSLRDEITNSSIMDYQGVTRRIESALLSGWKQVCNKQDSEKD
ncbi:O-linked N-acetylglucosamine transferase family protein [Candidatus Thiodiazotropha sp. CDECU1]|uniref:O-linked N-acetylglucosamine transferase family protein n=1 Tax=Candidatus Thiodiazotropha sp. CDECU1 TaxID=3065865 RepID=UPI002931EB82|nr:tetratricopeptide repeat protein [Candidatus Thiodiazotropha sp. CDECU1]